MKISLAAVALLIAVASSAHAGTCSFAPAVSYPAAAAGSREVVVADFNEDGYPDAAIIHPGSDFISYLPGHPGGTFGAAFAIPVGESHVEGLATVDWNQDGHMDLVVAIVDYTLNGTFVWSHLKFLYGRGDGTFSIVNGASSDLYSQNGDRMAVADFNNDGKPDLALLHVYGFDIYLNGSTSPFGHYLAPSGVGALEAIAAGDFDHDGAMDVAYSESTNNFVYVQFGNGNGTFGPAGTPLATQDPALEVDPDSLAAADFNGDGYDDIAVGSFDWRGTHTAKLCILLSNGNQTFAPSVNYGTIRNGNGIGVADFDGDGKLDVVVANDDPCCNSAAIVFPGNGDGTFGPQQAYSVSGAVRMAVADVDGNGMPDAVVVDFSGTMNVLRTRCHAPVAIASSTNPANAGSDFVITGTVGAVIPSPTGTITLSRNGTTLSSSDLATSNSATAMLNEFTAGTIVMTATYSGDSRFDPATATLTQTIVAPPFGAPPKLDALSFGGPVALTWIATDGVSQYEIYRNSGAGYTLVGTSPTAQFTDTDVAANAAYLYKVRGLAADASPSPFSPIDPAVTYAFTDATIVSGGTPIRLAHLIELRSAANALLAVAGGSSVAWGEASPEIVKASHWTELRGAVNGMRALIGLPPLAFTDSTLTGDTVVRAVHVEELRAGVR